MSSGRPSRRTFVQTVGMGAAAMWSWGQSTAQQAPARAPVMGDEDAALAAVVKKHTNHNATSVEKLNPGPWPWFDRYGDDSAVYYSVRCVEREYVVRVPLSPFSWGMAEYGLTDEYHAAIGRYVLDSLREAGQGAPTV